MIPARDLRLRHIRTFLEVARLESVSKAAKALNTSQPAVSRSLKDLETMLGVPLFDRVGRGLELNASGRTFQAHATNSMTELMQACNRISPATKHRTKLAVGTLPTAASDLLPNAILEFQKRDDRTMFRVMSGPNWLLFNQLRDGKLDLVVGRMPHAGKIQGLVFEQLYMERVVLVSRPGHPIRTTGPSDMPHLIGQYPVIMPPKGAVIWETVARYLASIGFPDFHGSIETVALPVGRRILEGSDALWFISSGVVADDIKTGRLEAIDLNSPLLAGPVGISQLQSSLISPEAKTFAQCLRTVARSGEQS